MRASKCGWTARYLNFRAMQIAHLGIDPNLGSNARPICFFGLRLRGYHNFRFPLPHISWRLGYRLRRVGGLRAYRLSYAFYCKFSNWSL